MKEDLNIIIKLGNNPASDLAKFFLLMSFNHYTEVFSSMKSDLFDYEWLSICKVFTSTLINRHRKKHDTN